MRKLKFSLILAALVIPAVIFQALAGAQDFILVNKTGVDIYELYIAPSKSDNWEEDMLDGDVFEDDDSLKISFDGRSETYWDIMVVDEEGTEVIFEGINLKKAVKIILHFDGEEAWADVK